MLFRSGLLAQINAWSRAEKPANGSLRMQSLGERLLGVMDKGVKSLYFENATKVFAIFLILARTEKFVSSGATALLLCCTAALKQLRRWSLHIQGFLKQIAKTDLNLSEEYLI